ncbi:hypothetical protein ISF6_0371 [Piscinibacter sakaiensis]|uniref:Lipoprotein n=1 Tax=Piscinibacter sakaiensis TaxID=1547922 RepID=A0A0K8NWY8_PISS1|nr:hypothetical protein ISF6_0371 [Piscinibacter sakaiensis]
MRTVGLAAGLAAALLALGLPRAEAQATAAGPAPKAADSRAAPARPAAAPAAPAARGGVREITWDALMPADWDPMKGIKAANFGMFSDADPRAAALLKEMRDSWDNAPVNAAMNGATVRIPGYVVPLEESKAGLSEFLLVPYFGACIHSPPPPANQIIHVLRKTPVKGIQSMDPVWVAGTLKTSRSDTFMGVSGYQLEASVVEPYTDPPPAAASGAKAR